MGTGEGEGPNTDAEITDRFAPSSEGTQIPIA